MKGLEQIAADEAALARSKRERCKFNVDDECITHDYSERCYTDGIADRYCFEACPHGCGIIPGRFTMSCLNCLKQLPYGPSRDDSPQVALEMRAAELAQDIENIGATILRRASFEAYGMNLFHNEPNETAPANDGEWAGYLAAQIAHHEEPSE